MVLFITNTHVAFHIRKFRDCSPNLRTLPCYIYICRVLWLFLPAFYGLRHGGQWLFRNFCKQSQNSCGPHDMHTLFYLSATYYSYFIIVFGDGVP